MKQLKSILVYGLWLAFLPFPGRAQQNVIHVFDAKEVEILQLSSQGVLSDARNNSVYFTIKGNIIFKGQSEAKKNIHLLVQSPDLFAKQPGKIFSGNMRKVLFTISQGVFFAGDKIDLFTPNQIAWYEKGKEDFLFIKNAADSSLIATITPGEVSNAELSAIFFYFYENYKMEVVLNENIATAHQAIIERNEGTIRPIWGSRLENEWMWDGRTLKPKWGNRPEDEWLFDGRSLKPYYQSNLDDEWLWDETTQNFKNAWRTGKRDEWTWEDGVLKPFWDADLKAHFVKEGNKVKPYWGHKPEQEWVIDGYLPLPVITLVVLGLADR